MSARVGALLGLLAAAILAALGAYLWHNGYDRGYEAHKAEVRQAHAVAEKDNATTKAADAQAEGQIRVEYVEVEKVIYRDGQTIIKKVPEYVTPKADSACTVPLGFVSLHDAAVRAANLGEKDATAGADATGAAAADALPVPEWVEQPAGVPLTRALAINATNYSAYALLRARYEKLVQWSQTQCYGPP